MIKIALFSSTFIWTNNTEGLMYNVEYGTCYSFHINDPLIKSLCSQWDELNNLYIAEFDESTISDTFRQFCKKIIEFSMGIILSSEQLPMSYPPRLKIKYSIDTIRSFGRKISTQPILPCLMRLVVFVGGIGDENDWWKQSLCHMPSSEKLSIERLIHFLTLYNTSGLKTIDIIYSDSEIAYLDSWVNALEPFKEKTRFVISSSNPSISSSEISLLHERGFRLAIFCTDINNIDTFKCTDDRYYYLPVLSLDDYQHLSNLVESSRPDIHFSIVPLADNNLDFFKDNVFMTEDEIRNQKLSYRDIFRHQGLNVNQFGTFYIFPDGTIHPAADAPSIGTLDDSAHDLIIRELEENHAWRQTRRLMEPCKNCIYHDLCPSPSVYERIFGVPGCTYWKDEDKE